MHHTYPRTLATPMRKGRFGPCDLHLNSYFLGLWLLLIAFSTVACTDISVGSGPFRPTAIASNVGTIPPMIVVSPTSGQGGMYVQVEGSGWPANSLILVALSDEMGRSGILAASNTDSNGSINTGFLYPISQRWLAPGPHTVVAYAASGNLQATAEFMTVAPGSEVTPAVQADLASTPEPAPPEEPAATSTVTPTVPLTPTITTPTPTGTPAAVTILDWRGEYWDNSTLTESPVLVRDDPAVAFDWGWERPADEVPEDYFSARWTRTLNFDEGTYRFYVEVDDGARLYLDGTLILDEWQIGSPRTRSVDIPVAAGMHTLQVEYFERTERALIRLWWEQQTEGSGWRGEYFANPDLQDPPVLIRDDALLEFEWGPNSPAPELPVDNFSVRWQRMVELTPGRYHFYVRSDDGARLWIDGELLLDNWQDDSTNLQGVDVDLPGGRHQLTVEYYERAGDALIQFGWETLTGAAALTVPTWTPPPVLTVMPNQVQATVTATGIILPGVTPTPTATLPPV